MHRRILIPAAVAALSLSLALAQADKKKAGGDPARGKALFAQCAVCHNTDSDVKKIGPGLKGLFKHAKLSNGKVLSEPNVRAVIDAGGNGMPSFKDGLQAAQKDDLLAYLKTL
jgi:cytochrome c